MEVLVDMLFNEECNEMRRQIQVYKEKTPKGMATKKKHLLQKRGIALDTLFSSLNQAKMLPATLKYTIAANSNACFS